jgi:hypothetical protein
VKTPTSSQDRPASRPGVLLTIEPLEERRAPAAFIVTLASPDSASVSGTLRWAITQSNLTPGPNTITFDIGAGGMQTISLTSPLPGITQPVSIFGGSQTGTTYSSPGIILNGAGATAGDGFDISAGGSTIEGFVIQGFNGHGIALSGKGGDEIINDGIGTNAALNGAVANTKDGVLITSSPNNAIQDCVIAGNKLNGIEITGSGAATNLIGAGNTANANVGTPTSTGDFIGVDISGTIAVPNLLDGVLIHASANHTTLSGDVISANSGNGVHITGTGFVTAGTGTTGNILLGNFIGTDLTGTKPLGNAGDGVLIDAGANITSIGDGTSANANVISANLGNGIHLVGTGIGNPNGGTTANVVLGNFIGTDLTGTQALGNTGDGVLIANGAGDNKIGGAGSVNVISANHNGVHISGAGQAGVGAGTAGNFVVGNYIGTDITGSIALGNIAEGILIDNGANSNTIGDGTAADANIISGNAGDGIHIDGGALVITSGHVGTALNSILANYVGTDASGTLALGNAGAGVLIDNGAATNTVGSDTTVNVIGANAVGIHIAGATSAGNTLLGNYIGTDVSGGVALGNTGDGILIDTGASGTHIGNDNTGGGNVISGNGVNGIHITGIGVVAAGGGTSGTAILGNFIGTDITGSNPVPNAGSGVLIDNGANATKIGDGTAAGANVISGNTGAGIHLDGSNLITTTGKVGTQNNLILGNFIGVGIAGSQAIGNSGDGILINDGATGNTIGSDTTHNIISANLNGIHITGIGAGASTSGTSGNILLGNYIGTDITGAAPLSNNANGVLLDNGAHGNKIGDGTPGGANVISANGANGIHIDGSHLVAGSGLVGTASNSILANLIGTDLTGAASLGNAADGILIDDGASGNTIGSATTHNVISGNLNGVHISGSGTTANVLIGNYIGPDITGTSGFVGNTADGVLIDAGASGNTIGAVGSHNLISGNSGNGIHITGTGAGAAGSGTTGNILLANTIGTDITGTQPLENAGDGVLIDNGANANQIGNGGASGANVISANGANGIHIDGSHLAPLTGQVGTANNTVLGNFIGTDLTGTQALANGNDGVLIENGATGNSIGSAIGTHNIISANQNNGVEITGAGTARNVILSDYIGTDITGALALGNGNDGVLIGAGATANTIGSATTHNVISANSNHGVEITGAGATGNTLLGNYIGVDKTGVKPLGNASNGVMIGAGATGNTIGGVTAGSANILSANGANGIQLDGAGTTLNNVLGNFIGTDLTGKLAVANASDGVLISGGASANHIGNATTAGKNIISGNMANGVEINTASNGNFIQGNTIGVTVAGAALGNTGSGVYVDSSSNNTIGGEAGGAGNIIQFNSGNGVTIASGAGNAIQQNSIFSNSLLGIDLNNDGVTSNGSPTTGANNGQNYPVIASALFANASQGTSVTFTFSGAPNTTYQIELFDSPTANASGYGEGKTPLTPTPILVTTGPDGVAINPATGTDMYTVKGLAGALSGTVVTGTATDPTLDTSEFSQAVAVTSAPPVVDNVTFATDSHGHTTGVVFTFSVPLAPSSVNTGDFQLFSAGSHATYTTPIKLAKVNPVVYHQTANSFTVTVTTASPIAAGHFIKAFVNGTTNPVTNTTGIALDGEYTGTLPSGNQVAGGDFSAFLEHGTRLSYKDSHTNTVALSIAHGGTIELIQPTLGAPGYLELAKVVSGKTTLSGSVKAGKTGTGSTSLEAIIGLAGAIDKLPPSEFSILTPTVTTLALAAVLPQDAAIFALPGPDASIAPFDPES